MAAVGDTQPTMALASAAPAAAPVIDNAAYLSTFPDVRAVTPVTMASASSVTGTPPPTDPIFRSLFQAGDRTQPVSPAVQELWGASAPRVNVASAASTTPEVRAPGRLDLFSDRDGTFSS